MTKHHLSPKTGQMAPCSAEDAACPYGGSEAHLTDSMLSSMSAADLVEFAQKQAGGEKGRDISKLEPPESWSEEKRVEFYAQQASVVDSSQNTGNFTTVPSTQKASKRESADTLTISARMTGDAVEEATTNILDTPNDEVDPEGAKAILAERGSLTQEMTTEAHDLDRAIEDATPRSPERKELREQLKTKRAEIREFRTRTAQMVEKMDNSFGFSDLTQWGRDDLGDSVKTTSHDADSREWLEARLDTVGGSDVGTLAMEHLVDESEHPWYHSKAMKGLRNSKLSVDENGLKSKNEGGSPVSGEESETVGYNRDASQNALYWGNAQESRIAKSFETDRGDDYEVFESKDQFVNKDREYQKVNVDGILRKKKTREQGILEIKNIAGKPYPPETDENGWGDADKDLPLNYRAQTLYYLNSTGWDYAVVRIQYNDDERVDFYLHADDEVRPGSGVSMSEFIDEHVEPFYREAKERRDKGDTSWE